jgi:hypothetical protein
MDAADGDLVDQGHESELSPAVDQERPAWPAQRGGKVPQQRGPREPCSDDDHPPPTLGLHATSHPQALPSGTSILALKSPL